MYANYIANIVSSLLNDLNNMLNKTVIYYRIFKCPYCTCLEVIN